MTPLAAPVADVARIAAAWAAMGEVPDPEVPAISLRDLGIVRAIDEEIGGTLEIVLTPTYSGCPATEVIEASVIEAIESRGLGPVRVRRRLAPAWTTDWISEEGRRKLHAYGIAPPGPVPVPASGAPIRLIARNVPCPRCASAATERLAAFGSTACKSLYRCLACREPFEYFKPI